MTVDEFKALKREVVDRSRWALSVAGEDIESMGLRYCLLGPLSISHIKGTLKVQLHFSEEKGGGQIIYIEHDGVEEQLGWQHKQLVRLYRRVLAIIAQELVLEDLASV